MTNSSNSRSDAVVVGSGPNGLAAAIVLAQAGLSVTLYEAKSTVGGGARCGELTLPGFMHDICSAVYPMAVASPFFRALNLPASELNWIQPGAAMAHPLDDGSAAILIGLGTEFSANLGADADAWRRLFQPCMKHGVDLFRELLAPLTLVPRHPLLMARFGLTAARSAQSLADKHLKTTAGRALFAGIAAHSLLPLEHPFSAATALALGLAAHISGWPIVEGGSQSISSALAERFRNLGGKIIVDCPVKSLRDLPAARLTLLDISASQFAEVAKESLPHWYRAKLRHFRPGPAIFKLDWALSQPVPWRAKECELAGTLHVGGTFEEIAESERAASSGKIPERPCLILSQPTLFDSSRCPRHKHILWGYCHVPLGCGVDMTQRIENQIERFAPGFRDCILARKVTTPQMFEAYNLNYSGGDISGGAMDWPQIFRRPVRWFKPYKTPIAGVYLCSASTPPGPGVHGMCGVHAARLALAELGIMAVS